MKKLAFLFSIGLLTAAPAAFAQESLDTGASTLHIIYVDNSNPSRQASGGLNKATTARLHIIADSARQGNSHILLFISNGERPYYTRDRAEMPDLLSRLNEEATRPPSSAADKKALHNILHKTPVSNFTQVQFDLFITYNTFSNELALKNSELIKFFPVEILHSTKARKCVVNIYISNYSGTESIAQLKDKYLVSGKFKQDYPMITYNFYQYKPL